MRILLIGSNGQLGNEFQKLFFIAIENIKDDYFELGMIAEKVMQDE